MKFYKTYEGARKRAAFENGLARHEYERGYKARHYRYAVVPDGDKWRVQRTVVKPTVSTTEARWLVEETTVDGIPATRVTPPVIK